MTMTILDQIIAQKRQEVKDLKAIYAPEPKERNAKRVSVYDSFRKSARMNLIAEVKRASPSKGVIKEGVDPVAQALAYASAGAGAISVLTDRTFFKGSMADLAAVAKAVDVPLLCKDFIIDPVQIDAAADHGASIILLIAAALDQPTMQGLYEYANEKKMDVLFEVHDEQEAERVLEAGAKLVGINNRNLKTFDVDLCVTERVAKCFEKEDVMLISESGLRTKEDVERVGAAGARGILVGETLMRAHDIEDTIKALRVPLPSVVL